MSINRFIKNNFSLEKSQLSTPSSAKHSRSNVASSELSKPYRKKYNHFKKYSQGSQENQESFIYQHELEKSLLGRASGVSLRKLSESVQIANKRVSVLNEKYMHKSRISQNEEHRKSKNSFIKVQRQNSKKQIQKLKTRQENKRQKLRKSITNQRINNYYQAKEKNYQKQVERQASSAQSRQKKIQIQAKIRLKKKQIEKQGKNKHKLVYELELAQKYKMQQFFLQKKKKINESKLIQKKEQITKKISLSRQISKFSKLQKAILSNDKNNKNDKNNINPIRSNTQVLVNFRKLSTSIRQPQERIKKRLTNQKRYSADFLQNMQSKRNENQSATKKIKDQHQKLKQLIEGNLNLKKKSAQYMINKNNRQAYVLPRLKELQNRQKSYQKYKI